MGEEEKLIVSLLLIKRRLVSYSVCVQVLDILLCHMKYLVFVSYWLISG